MSLSLSARNALICWCLAAGAPVLLGQTNYLPSGVEYAIAGTTVGDQVNPRISVNVSGGYLVWEDNVTDGDGLGISALKLDGSFSGSPGPLSSFRVNTIGAALQENPQVSLLNGGGAVFVWQGGQQGFQNVYARFLSAGGLWLGPETRANTFTNNSQVNPVVATLANGNVAVAWASFNQVASTSLQDVYATVLSPTGVKLTNDLRVNQFASFNQRNPAIAALSNGRFVLVWVSEQQRVMEPALDAYGNTAEASGSASVDVYGRLFEAGGAPVGSEFLVSTSTNLCSSPRVAAAPGGAFMVVWAERDRGSNANGWDIWSRTFSSSGTGDPVHRVNTTVSGDQYVPTLSWDGSDYLVTWISLGQDGSREGIFGRFLHSDGSADQAEFQVNTTWLSQQKDPAVASDGQGRFLAVWTSFVGGPSGFNLYAQRYVNVSQPLPQMATPFVNVPFVLSNGVYQPQILVSWPVQEGLGIDHYGVYVDGVATASATTNMWLMTAANGLTVSDTHAFQVDYVTTSGRRSPISPEAYGTTWDRRIYKNAIPAEWMEMYWEIGTAWPLPNDPVAPGGPTVLQVFLTGADPTNPATWLRTAMVPTAQGYFLTWNPQPGHTYQVQFSGNLGSWGNVGSPRFAADTVDSLYIGLSNTGYYRVRWLY